MLHRCCEIQADTVESLSPGILGVWTATATARWAGTCVAYNMHSHLHLPSQIELYLPRPPFCGASQMRQRYGFSSWQTVSTQPVSYHTRFFGQSTFNRSLCRFIDLLGEQCCKSAVSPARRACLSTRYSPLRLEGKSKSTARSRC